MLPRCWPFDLEKCKKVGEFLGFLGILKNVTEFDLAKYICYKIFGEWEIRPRIEAGRKIKWPLV